MEYYKYNPRFISADVATANIQFKEINYGESSPDNIYNKPPLLIQISNPHWTLVPTGIYCVTRHELNKLIDNFSCLNYSYATKLSQFVKE